jgi:hypothetical protein
VPGAQSIGMCVCDLHVLIHEAAVGFAEFLVHCYCWSRFLNILDVCFFFLFLCVPVLAALSLQVAGCVLASYRCQFL